MASEVRYNDSVMDTLKGEFSSMESALSDFSAAVEEFKGLFGGDDWKGDTATKFNSAVEELLSEIKEQAEPAAALVKATDTTKTAMSEAESEANAFVNR